MREIGRTLRRGATPVPHPKREKKVKVQFKKFQRSFSTLDAELNILPGGDSSMGGYTMSVNPRDTAMTSVSGIGASLPPPPQNLRRILITLIMPFQLQHHSLPTIDWA